MLMGKKHERRASRWKRSHLIIFSFLSAPIQLVYVCCVGIRSLLRVPWIAFVQNTFSMLQGRLPSNLNGNYRSEWRRNDAEIKGFPWCVLTMMKSFHLSRFKRKPNLNSMLLTHHLNGCYEYLRVMMFNTTANRPERSFIPMSQVVKLFCVGTSPISKVLFSLKIFKSSHLDGVEVLYCSIDSLRCSASSGASKCFALQLMKLLFNASAIQRCSRQILSPHQPIKCFWSFFASG